jgi:hypothetical protein
MPIHLLFDTLRKMNISVLVPSMNQYDSCGDTIFVLAVTEGVFNMVGIPSNLSFRLPKTYKVGNNLPLGWHLNPIDFDLMKTFNGFVFAEIDDMKEWLFSSANQIALTNAIQEHFLDPTNLVLEYDINTCRFSLANY